MAIKKNTKLIIIKSIHTLIWFFFNVVIFYMLYAVVTNRIDQWLWIGYGFFILEGIILLIFKFFCPLTLLARRYSDSGKANFDIYLPEWLAKNNKLIYLSLLFVIFLITIYRLIP
jgi:uncharacterized membrane protein YhaH (DUF805 family)